MVGSELVQHPVNGGAGVVVEDARGRQACVAAPDPVAADASGVDGSEATPCRAGYILENTGPVTVVVLPPGLLGRPIDCGTIGVHSADNNAVLDAKSDGERRVLHSRVDPVDLGGVELRAGCVEELVIPKHSHPRNT